MSELAARRATRSGVGDRSDAASADRATLQVLETRLGKPLSRNRHVTAAFAERDGDGWELHVFVDSLEFDVTRPVIKQVGIAIRAANKLRPTPMDIHIWPRERAFVEQRPSLHKLFAH